MPEDNCRWERHGQGCSLQWQQLWKLELMFTCRFGVMKFICWIFFGQQRGGEMTKWYQSSQHMPTAVSELLCVLGRWCTPNGSSQTGSVRPSPFLMTVDVQINGNESKFALKQVPGNPQPDACTPCWDQLDGSFPALPALGCLRSALQRTDEISASSLQHEGVLCARAWAPEQIVTVTPHPPAEFVKRQNTKSHRTNPCGPVTDGLAAGLPRLSETLELGYSSVWRHFPTEGYRFVTGVCECNTGEYKSNGSSSGGVIWGLVWAYYSPIRVIPDAGQVQHRQMKESLWSVVTHLK